MAAIVYCSGGERYMDDIDGHMMGLLILCSTVKLIFIPLTRDAIPKTTARHGGGTVMSTPSSSTALLSGVVLCSLKHNSSENPEASQEKQTNERKKNIRIARSKSVQLPSSFISLIEFPMHRWRWPSADLPHLRMSRAPSSSPSDDFLSAARVCPCPATV